MPKGQPPRQVLELLGSLGGVGGAGAGSLQHGITGEPLESTRMIQNGDFKELK